jgi:hypothetical protein
MALSVHDNRLISYDVRCEERTITLRTEYHAENKPTEFTNVVFEGVEGYHFANDAFENIIFDVVEVPCEEFLTEYGAEISELYRMTGSPKWATDMDSAAIMMRAQRVNGFVLSSSLGLSGWVLAKEMSVTLAE